MLDLLTLLLFSAALGVALARLWMRDKALDPRRGDVHTVGASSFYVAGVRQGYVLVSVNGELPARMSLLAWYHLVRG